MISPIAALQKDNHATVRRRRKREPFTGRPGYRRGSGAAPKAGPQTARSDQNEGDERPVRHRQSQEGPVDLGAIG
jgi:hypothetical protein